MRIAAETTSKPVHTVSVSIHKHIYLHMIYAWQDQTIQGGRWNETATLPTSWLQIVQGYFLCIIAVFFHAS